jgi:hypothetical protein
VPEGKVVVDTRPPLVTLRQSDDRRPNIVTVEWDARDENLDLNRFVLEYRVPGRTDWVRDERTQPNVTGVLSWNLDPGVRMEVRLRAFDRAGNVGESSIPLGLGVDGRPTGNSSVPSGGAALGIHFSRSRTIVIPCRVSVGISGTRDFELWYTRDSGRAWVKAPKTVEGPLPGLLPDRPAESAATPVEVKLKFDADADGLYGFTIVIRNGVGVGDADPRPGDPPRFSVIVDTQEPELQLRVTPGVGADMRNVTVQWVAKDLNLTDRPVTLEYAEIKDGAPEWKSLPKLLGPQDRSGTYVWTIDRSGPFKFHIRATAADKAQNSKSEQTKDPVIIDLEHPRVDIIGIEPGSPKP